MSSQVILTLVFLDLGMLSIFYCVSNFYRYTFRGYETCVLLSFNWRGVDQIGDH